MAQQVKALEHLLKGVKDGTEDFFSEPTDSVVETSKPEAAAATESASSKPLEASQPSADNMSSQDDVASNSSAKKRKRSTRVKKRKQSDVAADGAAPVAPIVVRIPASSPLDKASSSSVRDPVVAPSFVAIPDFTGEPMSEEEVDVACVQIGDEEVAAPLLDRSAKLGFGPLLLDDPAWWYDSDDEDRASAQNSNVFEQRKLLAEPRARTPTVSEDESHETYMEIRFPDLEGKRLRELEKVGELRGNDDGSAKAGGDGPKEKEKEKDVKYRRKTASDERFYLEVARDEQGNVKMPLRFKGLTVHSLGTVTNRPKFHNARYIWPIGYRSTRDFQSLLEPRKRCQYDCEILDNGNEPVFKVTSSEFPDQPFEGATASAAWQLICERLATLKAKWYNSVAKNPSQLSGPEYFGYSVPTVAYLIQNLPGVEQLHRYEMKTFKSAGRTLEEANAMQSRRHVAVSLDKETAADRAKREKREALAAKRKEKEFQKRREDNVKLQRKRAETECLISHMYNSHAADSSRPLRAEISVPSLGDAIGSATSPSLSTKKRKISSLSDGSNAEAAGKIRRRRVARKKNSGSGLGKPGEFLCVCGRVLETGRGWGGHIRHCDSHIKLFGGTSAPNFTEVQNKRLEIQAALRAAGIRREDMAPIVLGEETAESQATKRAKVESSL